jgi:hypothetical protein
MSQEARMKCPLLASTMLITPTKILLAVKRLGSM